MLVMLGPKLSEAEDDEIVFRLVKVRNSGYIFNSDKISTCICMTVCPLIIKIVPNIFGDISNDPPSQSLWILFVVQKTTPLLISYLI